MIDLTWKLTDSNTYVTVTGLPDDSADTYIHQAIAFYQAEQEKVQLVKRGKSYDQTPEDYEREVLRFLKYYVKDLHLTPSLSRHSETADKIDLEGDAEIFLPIFASDRFEFAGDPFDANPHADFDYIRTTQDFIIELMDCVFRTLDAEIDRLKAFTAEDIAEIEQDTPIN